MITLRNRARWRLVLALSVALACAGCQVDFTEKEALGSPLMDLREDPTEANFNGKATDSREGSAGARGGGAGGGCGCY